MRIGRYPTRQYRKRADYLDRWIAASERPAFNAVMNRFLAFRFCRVCLRPGPFAAANPFNALHRLHVGSLNPRKPAADQACSTS
jgi:hypothetical protein